VVIAPVLLGEFQYWRRKFSPFSSLTSVPKPASADFGLVINKIGVNVPVVANVDVSEKEIYKEALRHGVAHALGSSLPRQEAGTVLLFAHSSLDFWALGKYATVFNLLPKLEVGDYVTIYYQGKEYNYKVIKKEVVNNIAKEIPEGFSDQSPLLILQTCYPIGTTLKRLLVVASLVKT